MRTAEQRDDPESVDVQSVASTDLTVGHYARKPLRIGDRHPLTPGQLTFSCLFYGQLLVQLVACVWLLSAYNSYPLDGRAACDPSYELDASRGLCIKAEVKARLDSCVPEVAPAEGPPPEDENERGGGEPFFSRWGERRLEGGPEREGSMAERNGGLLLCLLGVVGAVCLAWFFLLAHLARWVVWGTLAANVVLMCYLFCLTSNWMLLVTAAVVLVLAYLARAKIELAVQAIGLAAVALRDTPGTFVVCFAFRAAWVVYAVCLCFVGWFCQNSVDVAPDCELGSSYASAFWVLCCPMLLILTTLFFKNCMLVVVAMSVGCWYFPEVADLQEVACGSPALYAGGLALTTSSGSVFGASLIMGVVEGIQRTVDHPCWWLDPTTCALKALGVCLEETIGTLTRFALIAHVFHGDGVCHMAGITKELLSRHLPDAVATGFLANVIMNQIAMSLSTGFGFLVWLLLDRREEIGVFRTIGSVLAQEAGSEDGYRGSQLLVALLTWAMYLGARRPISTLFWSVVCMIFAPLVDWLFSCPGMLESYLVSQFMAALAAIVFSYMGCVLEYATDTVFYCMAIESEAGRCDARTMKLHDMVQEQLEEQEEKQ